MGLRQANQAQGLSQKPEGALVPGRGVYPPHGLGHGQRSTPDSMGATQQVCGIRWTIEPLHRHGKQVTGLGRGPAGAEKRALRAIISGVLSSSGADSKNWPLKQVKRSID
jgi:hypothetical protein